MFKRRSSYADIARLEIKYYIKWDEVKTVEELKAIIMAIPGSGGNIGECAADSISRINPNLIMRVGE